MADKGFTRFTVRMPNDLYKQLKQLAKNEFRPMSQEVLFALKEYLNNHKNGQAK